MQPPPVAAGLPYTAMYTCLKPSTDGPCDGLVGGSWAGDCSSMTVATACMPRDRPVRLTGWCSQAGVAQRLVLLTGWCSQAVVLLRVPIAAGHLGRDADWVRGDDGRSPALRCVCPLLRIATASLR